MKASFQNPSPRAAENEPRPEVGLPASRLDGSGQLPAVLPASARNRYPIRHMAKPVHFYCAAPGAKSVRLVGDFNDWDATAHPMERRQDGWWFLEVALTHGHHEYQFLVDGKPVLDPKATGAMRDETNGDVSILAVS
jgi:hypothetical protein